MATVRKSKPASTTGKKTVSNVEQKKLKRGLLLIASLLLIVVSCVLALWWIKNRLFAENKRFTLRVVEIHSTGYWAQNENNRVLLLQKVNLQPGRDNLMAMDLPQLRQTLRNIPNIADAQISMELPDKLKISIDERIPWAFIGKKNGNWVVDSEGLIMESKECFGVHSKLPVISVLQRDILNVKSGNKLPAAAEPLKLLAAVKQTKSFTVNTIIALDDKLCVNMEYHSAGKSSNYMVNMPVGNYEKLLNQIQTVIDNAIKRNERFTVVNVLYNGQTVLSK